MIAPRFIKDDNGKNIAYADGTPLLTQIADIILAKDPATRKFLDVVIVGNLGYPRSELDKKNRSDKDIKI